MARLGGRFWFLGGVFLSFLLAALFIRVPGPVPWDRFSPFFHPYFWGLWATIPLATFLILLGKNHRIKELEDQVAGYVRLMAAAPDPIVHYDTKGRVLYLNPAFTRGFGWSLEACQGRKMDHFVPEAHWKETREMIQRVATGRDISGVETRRYTREGEMLEVSISGASVQDREGAFAGSIIILRDITRAWELERSLILAGEREQHRIGRDLHDDLCPHLLGMAGLTAALGEDAAQGRAIDPALTTTLLDLTEDAVAKARQLARGLCPVHLAAQGLQGLLAQAVKGFEHHRGIRFFTWADPAIECRDNGRAFHLYYIAREAMANGVKHSRGDEIQLVLEKEILETGEWVHLSIVDNGRGMDLSLASRGMGMETMARRARIMDARFEVESSPSGTRVHVRLAPDSLMSGGEEQGKWIG